MTKRAETTEAGGDSVVAPACLPCFFSPLDVENEDFAIYPLDIYAIFVVKSHVRNPNPSRIVVYEGLNQELRSEVCPVGFVDRGSYCPGASFYPRGW